MVKVTTRIGILFVAAASGAEMDRSELGDSTSTCNTYTEKRGQRSFGWDNKYYFCSEVPGSLLLSLTGDVLSDECRELCDAEPRCASYEVARPAIRPLYESLDVIPDEIPNCNLHLSSYASGDLYVDSSVAPGRRINNCQREASCWTHYDKVKLRDCDGADTGDTASSDQDELKGDTKRVISMDDLWLEGGRDDWVKGSGDFEDDWFYYQSAAWQDWENTDNDVSTDPGAPCRLLADRDKVSADDANWYRERLTYFVDGGCSKHDDFMTDWTYPRNETHITSLLDQAYRECSQALIKAESESQDTIFNDTNAVAWKFLCSVLIVVIVSLLLGIIVIAMKSNRKVSSLVTDTGKIDTPVVV